MSKYNVLWKYLQEKNKDIYRMTFDEIRDITGFQIDHSFLTYKKEAKLFGYEVEKIMMIEKTIIFVKTKKIRSYL